MATKGKTKDGKNESTLAEQRRKALELRKAGAGYEDISRKLGLAGPGSAYKIVQTALKNTYREPADDVRKLELERLDRLTLALWTRSKNGDEIAIDRVLKIMDRRAKLLGLDAPTKIIHPVSTEENPIEKIASDARKRRGTKGSQ